MREDPSRLSPDNEAMRQPKSRRKLSALLLLLLLLLLFYQTNKQINKHRNNIGLQCQVHVTIDNIIININ